MIVAAVVYSFVWYGDGLISPPSYRLEEHEY
jgi:hypothetical protein